MMQILLAIIGLSSGLTVAGGVIALIISLRLVPRLMGVTNTVKHVALYESSLLVGASIFNKISLFDLNISPYIPQWLGITFMLVMGVFAGMFVGALAIALAETLNVLPIFMRRTHLQMGVGFILLALAIGKCVGTLAQFYMGWVPQ